MDPQCRRLQQQARLEGLLWSATDDLERCGRVRTSCGLAARLLVRMQLMTSRTMRIKSANTCDSGGAASTPAAHQNPQDASVTAHHSRDITGISDAATLNLCAIESQHITWTEGFRV